MEALAWLVGFAFRCLLVIVFITLPFLLVALLPEWLQRVIEKVWKAIGVVLKCTLALCLIPFVLIALGVLVTIPGAWAVFLALGTGYSAMKK